jgi:hypothetical protein
MGLPEIVPPLLAAVWQMPGAIEDDAVSVGLACHHLRKFSGFY